MEKIRVMIVGNNDNKIFEIKSLLGTDQTAFIGFSKQNDIALEKAISLNPNVIIIQCEEEYSLAIDFAKEVYVKLPGCCVVLICDKLEVDIIEEAMQAGVRKVLKLPIDSAALTEKVIEAFDFEKSRFVNVNPAAVNKQSRLITVFGAKGGIGKTTISANMAALLAKMGNKVAIIDTDLQFGDVNVFFDIDSKDTIAEIAQDRDASDIDSIKRAALMHFSGVSILCAPKSPEYAEYVSAKNIETIITTMRPYYDYIIIDTTPLFNDATMVALENANLILLVTGMDISSLRNTKTSLNILESLQQADKAEVVVNKMTRGIITLKDIERVLGMTIKNKISLDYKTALACHNKGVPIVLDSPRTTISKELTQVVKNTINSINNRG